MTPSKRISLIIPFHNRKRFLRSAIKSALSEIDPSQDEIIAINDGSTDKNTTQSISSLPVKIISLPKSMGPSVARNEGIKEAQGKYIAFLDSDDLLTKSSLSVRAEYLESHSREVAVGGSIERLIDENGHTLPDDYSTRFDKIKAPPYRLSRDFIVDHRDFPMHLWLFLFRKEVFEKIGLFDAWLRCGEDLDFILRLLIGYESVPIINCPVARYRIHGENLSVEQQRTKHGRFKCTPAAVASQLLVCKKYDLPLEETPFHSKKSFQFGELTIALEHPNGPLGARIEEEYCKWEIADCEKPMATFKITSGVKPARPKEGSVRIRFFEEFKSYAYSLGKSRTEIVQDNYYAESDLDQLSAHVTYQKFEPIVAQLGGSVFKWLIVKGLEKMGFGYIHGACVEFNQQLIIFCGDPGSGKSSCAMRLLSEGAKLLSDDTVLFKNGTIVPFDHIPSVRGDFKTRFDLKKDTPTIPDHRRLFSPVSSSVALVVFPRVWESENSKCIEFSKEEAHERLMATYIKETEWNTYPENLKNVRAGYEGLLKKAKHFEFLQGKNEFAAKDLLFQQILSSLP